MAELYPRLEGLARLARQYDIGLNIDAEESTASTCRSISWRGCAPRRRWPDGTASASSSRRTRSARRSWSTS